MYPYEVLCSKVSKYAQQNHEPSMTRRTPRMSEFTHFTEQPDYYKYVYIIH